MLPRQRNHNGGMLRYLFTSIAIICAFLGGQRAVGQSCADPACPDGEWCQWSIAEGGDGHWYRITDNYGTWVQAEDEAVAAGGHMATINSEPENTWLSAKFKGYYSEENPGSTWASFVWIGYYLCGTDPKEPNDWCWISGEPVTYRGDWWFNGQPGTGEHAYLHPCSHPDPETWWNVGGQGPDPAGGHPKGIIEAQDCNANGIPDECDIDCGPASGPCDVPDCGQSDDCNGNGVPDECDLTDGTLHDLNTDTIPDECGACCSVNGVNGCTQVSEEVCLQDPNDKGTYLGDLTVCLDDGDQDGYDDACQGACCAPPYEGGCTLTDRIDCKKSETGAFQGEGTACGGDADQNGIDDACESIVPTVSEWSLILMALVVLTGGTIALGRRDRHTGALTFVTHKG